MPTASGPWHPAKGAGGGAALPPRGGSSASGPARASARGAITPLILPASTPAASTAGAPRLPLAAAASASGSGTAVASAGAGGAIGASNVSLIHPAAETSSGPGGQTGQGTGGLTSPPMGARVTRTRRRRAAARHPGSTPDPVISNTSGAASGLVPHISPFTYWTIIKVSFFTRAWSKFASPVTWLTLRPRSLGPPSRAIHGTQPISRRRVDRRHHTYELTFRWDAITQSPPPIP